MRIQLQSFFKILVLLWFLLPLFNHDTGNAQIYRYQDENGVWHYTDNPVNLPQKSESVDTVQSGGNSAGSESIPQNDLVAYLKEKFPQRNQIETAISKVVSITSPKGSGSGFFITNDGYIITNRHVLVGDKNRIKDTEKRIESFEGGMKDIKRQLNEEEERLEDAKDQLAKDKEMIDKQPDGSTKRYNQKLYEYNKRELERWERDLDRRKSRFRRAKDYTDDQISSYNMSNVEAYYAKNFKILVADNTELTVRLIKISEKHDLALLKLDGYKTPSLLPTRSKSVAAGEPVYAIGNPISLKFNAAKGVVSGFQDGYVKTDAHIYPGNSGGPLVTPDGRVIGINTLKQLTYKFEGLGFAIPIETAISEFRGHLGGRVTIP